MALDAHRERERVNRMIGALSVISEGIADCLRTARKESKEFGDSGEAAIRWTGVVEALATASHSAEEAIERLDEIDQWLDVAMISLQD